MRCIVTILTALALAVTLLVAPTIAVADQEESSPHSRVCGKTLGEWMQLYWTWYYGGGPDHVGDVKFLPLPNGTPVGDHQFTYADPGTLQGHLDVTLDLGTSFVLPEIAWVGETYDPALGYPDDPPIPASFFTDPRKGAISKVYIDGRRVMDSTKESVRPFYYGPVPLHVTYPAPSSYGSTGAIFCQGIGFIHEPLSVGTHTIVLESQLLIPPNGKYLNLSLYPDGVGIHYLNTWTITVLPVLPPDSRPYGKSLGAWADRWWRWAYSIPVDTNPVIDPTGEFAAVGQSGPVWFLAGTFGGTAERTVTVPADKMLFFPIVDSIWVNTPEFGDNPWSPDQEAYARGLVAGQIDLATGLSCEIDGHAVQNITTHRHQTPEGGEFMVTFPENNVWGIPAGTYGPSVSDGYYLMLAPLSAGQHTIHFAGAIGDWSLDVTYDITVVRDRRHDRDGH